MSGSKIKFLACVFMLVDHMGVILFPDLLVLRVIGRLSFPLFAWGISVGYVHTRNVKKYIGRLLAFAFLYQLPFILPLPFIEDIGQVPLNIFFTLSLGLMAIYLYDKSTSIYSGLFYVVLIGLFSHFINADYGMYGVATIFLFYACRSDFKKLLIYQTLLNLLNTISAETIYLMKSSPFDTFSLIQLASIFALIFIYSYNESSGRNSKLFFYSFYPAHLLLLYAISILR